MLKWAIPDVSAACTYFHIFFFLLFSYNLIHPLYVVNINAMWESPLWWHGVMSMNKCHKISILQMGVHRPWLTSLYLIQKHCWPYRFMDPVKNYWIRGFAIWDLALSRLKYQGSLTLTLILVRKKSFLLWLYFWKSSNYSALNLKEHVSGFVSCMHPGILSQPQD